MLQPGRRPWRRGRNLQATRSFSGVPPIRCRSPIQNGQVNRQVGGPVVIGGARFSTIKPLLRYSVAICKDKATKFRNMFSLGREVSSMLLLKRSFSQHIFLNYSEVRGGVAATLGTFFHSTSTVGGSLSICLRNIATFQISSSCSVVVKLGIAVKWIPCFTFQNDAATGSSSTPSLASCGASI